MAKIAVEGLKGFAMTYASKANSVKELVTTSLLRTVAVSSSAEVTQQKIDNMFRSNSKDIDFEKVFYSAGVDALGLIQTEGFVHMNKIIGGDKVIGDIGGMFYNTNWSNHMNGITP
jgi:hypothetical protein